jgi:hypothetical protein
MSEYQYVAFRAIDAPVSKKNLAYMRRQSTRAEITRRSFDNEYDFGDFRGDAIEMLRRGYDLHLHYANFGTRSLYFRLPQGFPDSKAAKKYLDGESMRFVKDRQGPGGVLAIEPGYEPGDLEELWDIDKILDRLAPLRREILEGDLRPLYLAHLAVSCDFNHDPDETIEAPVPAGLNQLTKPQQALASLYEISDALVAAAAQEFAAVPAAIDRRREHSDWISRQSESTKNAWLTELLSGPKLKLRTEILAKFSNDHPEQSWPTVKLDRTIAELRQAAEEIQNALDQKAAANAARKRDKKLAEMASDPDTYLRQTEQLVAQRTTNAYDKVGALLADLRDALADSGRSDLAERQALKLKQLNPTLRHLTAALRRQGFLPK